MWDQDLTVSIYNIDCLFCAIFFNTPPQVGVYVYDTQLAEQYFKLCRHQWLSEQISWLIHGSFVSCSYHRFLNLFSN